MSIEIVKGCLLSALDAGDVDVIGHVVNCQSVMGSGIALSIKQRYPKVFQEYLRSFPEAFKEGVKPEGMLGHTEVINGVANLYAQFRYGSFHRDLNYGALSQCLSSLSQYAGGHLVYGFPYKMGSDRAKGDWDIVLEMIEFYFKNSEVKIYKLEN